MEKTKNRENYVKGFREFVNKVELNESFMNQVKENFVHHWNNIKDAGIEAKKYYIFLELTQDRGSCDIIIEMLEKSNQSIAAEILKQYNKSSGIIDILRAPTHPRIPVSKRETPKESYNPTNSYEMFQNPRGKFIIINNIPEEVYAESQRFQHVFSELSFQTQLYSKLNVKQIRELLEGISRDTSLMTDEAFGLMIITHGGDEKVLGYDAIEKSKEPVNRDTSKMIAEDQIKFCELVQIFTKCTFLDAKPKMFIFNCCRNKNQNALVDNNSYSVQSFDACIESSEEKMECDSGPQINNDYSVKYRGNWVNENTDTFIIHSCSEGCYSYYDKFYGITFFGQALSHAIAYYAVDESLQSIMGRMCTLMEQFRKILVYNHYFGESAYSKPEFKYQCVRRKLLFNPGVKPKTQTLLHC